MLQWLVISNQKFSGKREVVRLVGRRTKELKRKDILLEGAWC
jgi:hypothetical protein